jgi:hypothetical protein
MHHRTGVVCVVHAFRFTGGEHHVVVGIQQLIVDLYIHDFQFNVLLVAIFVGGATTATTAATTAAAATKGHRVVL